MTRLREAVPYQSMAANEKVKSAARKGRMRLDLRS